MRAPLAASILALAATGCSTIDPGALAMAIMAAATSSVEQRATGGCWAECAYGTTCNQVTGVSDPLPCGGDCNRGAQCVGTGGDSRCELLFPETAQGEERLRRSTGEDRQAGASGEDPP